MKKPRKLINSIDNLEEVKSLDMITTDTNPTTELPYQGFISNQEYYDKLKADCFGFDSAINELVQKRFSGNNLRQMSDKDAIEAFKVMETAKSERTKAYLELSKLLASNDFYNKMAEVERLRAYGSGKIIDAETGDEAIAKDEEPKKISEEDRTRQQSILAMLQSALVNKIKKGDNGR